MNPLNYASLEASKRLADAGIVLETEAWWRVYDRKYNDPQSPCFGHCYFNGVLR